MLAYRSSSLRSATIGELYPATFRDGELPLCEHQFSRTHNSLPDGPKQSCITPFFQYSVGRQVQYHMLSPATSIQDHTHCTVSLGKAVPVLVKRSKPANRS